MLSLEFYQQILIPLTMMPVAGLALLLLILEKAPLCRGQRGRISGSLFSCWVVLALSVMMAEQAGVSWPVWLLGGVAAAAGIGLSVWEAKIERPLDHRYYGIPAVLALVYLVLAGSQVGMALSWILGLAGALAFGHLLLLRAKHRLTAFDRILPLAGIIFTAVSLCLMAVLLWRDPQMAQDQTRILIWIALLLVSILTWCGPWLLKRPIQVPAVGIATTLLLAANAVSTQVLWP